MGHEVMATQFSYVIEKQRNRFAPLEDRSRTQKRGVPAGVRSPCGEGAAARGKLRVDGAPLVLILVLPAQAENLRGL